MLGGPLDDNERTKLEKFKSSYGWLSNVLRRAGIVTRCSTAVRVYPDNAGDIAYTFMSEVQALIKEHNIQKQNVINMDQVPRYFEGHQRKTFSDKASKRVLLRKSSGHKRFTATFAINGLGELLPPHLLFSKLKRKPKVGPRCLVDVNVTGMWAGNILKEWLNEVILKRPATAMYRQPTLLIMDSYTVHKKLLTDKAYMDLLERKNVRFVSLFVVYIYSTFLKNCYLFNLITSHLCVVTGIHQNNTARYDRSFATTGCLCQPFLSSTL